MVKLLSTLLFLFLHAENLRAGPDRTCAPSQHVDQESKGGGEGSVPENPLFRARSFGHLGKN
jgi:hypothetical protein